MFYTFDFQLQNAPAALTFVKESTIQLVLCELFFKDKLWVLFRLCSFIKLV